MNRHLPLSQGVIPSPSPATLPQQSTTSSRTWLILRSGDESPREIHSLISFFLVVFRFRHSKLSLPLPGWSIGDEDTRPLWLKDVHVASV